MPRPLLFVGDIHLGRSPHRLAAAGLEPLELSPAEAWRRVVRYAIDNKVQAVILAGDVVDKLKDIFEAYGSLQRGVADLVRENIQVIGVAGNHDAIALPRLASRIPEFCLLGKGGCWERVELDGFDLIGWSFPAQHYSLNPLDSDGLQEALNSRRSDALAIGVLHGDLDAASSVYAPVSRADLSSIQLSAWFLGHVHVPSELSGAFPIGYLGSLTGLGRGEMGRRGPWLVRRNASNALELEQLALGPVYWTTLQVDLSSVELAGDDAHETLHSAIHTAISEFSRSDTWVSSDNFGAVGCVVHFVGRTNYRGVVQAYMAQRKPRELVFSTDGVSWAVVEMKDQTRPKRDLGMLANEKTPLGRLAELLTVLDRDGLETLPEQVLREISNFEAAPWSVNEEDNPLPDPEQVVRESVLMLIDQLLEQSPKGA